MIQFARDLRKNATDAERRIWHYLRYNRLAGQRFRRQHPIGPYVADFYRHTAGLVVELDGGQHREPQAIAHDALRTAYFAERGLRVIRFSDYEALKDA
jgi:very-short-patch-repair endonuclease